MSEFLQHVRLDFPSGLSPDDIQARIGKLTASRMSDAMDFLKNGNESKIRAKYKKELVAERLTDIIVPHHVTPAMEHGIMYEPEAKKVYQELTGERIASASFLDHPTLDNFGATPDGYLDGGLIEIKCPTTPTFIDWMLSKDAPEEHKPQMAAQVLVTGKPWVMFVAYDPRMPERKRMLTRRFEPSGEYLDLVFRNAETFLREVDAMFDLVSESPS